MNQFFLRTTLGSIISLSALSAGLNIAAFWLHHWLYLTIVFIADLGLVACFALWTSHHILKFARPAAREYKKLRHDLRDN